ncbi:MAG: hypothetical protein WCI01_07120 [Chlorobiaceae bacterium]
MSIAALVIVFFFNRYSNYGVGSAIDPGCAAKTTKKVFVQQQVLTKTLNEIIDESPYKGE